MKSTAGSPIALNADRGVETGFCANESGGWQRVFIRLNQAAGNGLRLIEFDTAEFGI